MKLKLTKAFSEFPEPGGRGQRWTAPYQRWPKRKVVQAERQSGGAARSAKKIQDNIGLTDRFGKKMHLLVLAYTIFFVSTRSANFSGKERVALTQIDGR